MTTREAAEFLDRHYTEEDRCALIAEWSHYLETGIYRAKFFTTAGHLSLTYTCSSFIEAQQHVSNWATIPLNEKEL